MKKLILFSLFISFYACKKTPFDYRNKYLGSYKFKTETSYWGPGSSSPGTVSYYQGKIEYGANSDEIIIYFMVDKAVAVSVDKDGIISRRNATGSFDSKKSMHFNWGDGHVSGIAYAVTGEKKPRF